jgi:hypothetical protein
VGGYLDNSLNGAAWVYARSGSIWTQQGGKLVGTGFSKVTWRITTPIIDPGSGAEKMDERGHGCPCAGPCSQA